MIRGLWSLMLAVAALGQTIPLKDRVLILVNDRVPESLAVGRYYAAKRDIPAGNILRLKMSTAEGISAEEFKEQIETPLKKFLDANDGAMRRKIVYIVPTYGVPVRAGPLAVDSVISVMYVGHEDLKPPLHSPYSAPVGSRPPHFAEWSDTVAAAQNFKMFVVTRLDGPSAEIAKGLVDKALAGEQGLSAKSGVAYFDAQGTRQPNEWQYAVDKEIQSAAELSRKQGFETVLHIQKDALCGSLMPSASQHSYDPVKKNVPIETAGASTGLEFSFPALPEADFQLGVAYGTVANTGNSVTLTLGGAGEKNYVRLVYPFVPFRGWDTHSEIVLEKVVDGAAVARTAVPVANNEQLMNTFSSLRISVRKSRISAWRNQTEVAAVEDKSGKPLMLEKASLTAVCWCFGIKSLLVTDAAGGKSWEDNFDTDTRARYRWHLSPLGGPNALWAWGWYGPAYDAYRFVPGAVGAHLTSFTALTIRTPANADPGARGWANLRWAGNWVPRMLEEGVTATWGATNEPYATFYAQGGNVFDHLWAGYNFGDSFYIAENAVGWVMVAVGDPLYKPKFTK
jgi:uncharacterized protein (TIGR03790 family)